MRRHLCETLPEVGVALHLLGRGWARETMKGAANWRAQKQIDIEESGADFVFCPENSRLPGYISEKLHDGMASDRVALYLGEPEIERHVPPGCYVNLNRLLDPRTKRFDVRALADLITTMDQATYDEILRSARAFRRTLAGRFEAAQDRMTDLLIERMTRS